MPTLRRDQIVLSMLKSEGTGFNAVADTVAVTKTATMTVGTLIKADNTEASATELAEGTFDIKGVITDSRVDTVDTGDVVHVTVVDRLDLCVLRGALLLLGSTALSGAQLVLLSAGSKAKIQ